MAAHAGTEGQQQTSDTEQPYLQWPDVRAQTGHHVETPLRGGSMRAYRGSMRASGVGFEPCHLVNLHLLAGRCVCELVA